MTDADREILDHFVRIRNKTIDTAGRIDEELLCRAAAGDRPLNELFLHIADGVDRWMAGVMKDGGPARGPYKHDKESVIAALAASRDRLIRFFSGDDGQRMARGFGFVEDDGSTREWTGRDRVLYLTDHEIHHRGRIELALWQMGFSDLPHFP